MKLTAVFMKVPEGYIAFVEELPGANTQGATLEAARENLKEAVAIVFDANRELAEHSLEGDRHTMYVNRKARGSSAVPRHREVNEFIPHPPQPGGLAKTWKHAGCPHIMMAHIMMALV